MAEYVNVETGEIKDFAYTRTIKQQEAWQNIMAQKKKDQEESDTFWKKERDKAKHGFKKDRQAKTFTITDMDNIKTLQEGKGMSGLNAKHLGYFLMLQSYVNWDNVLFKSREAKTPMNRKEIGEVLELGNGGTVKRNIETLIKHELLFEIDYTLKDGTVSPALKVNDLYHYKGATNSKHFLKGFNTTVRELYKQSGAGDLGFIYALLPYVHQEQNVLCKNPYELDPLKIDVLTLKDMAEITGLSDRSVREKRSELAFEGMVVIKAEIHNKGKRLYRLNPFVFYRKEGDPPQILRDSFLIKGK